MNNGNIKDAGRNTELFECIQSVAKEMARHVKKTTKSNQKANIQTKEISPGKREKRISILDELPVTVETSKRPQESREDDDVNVVMLGHRASVSTSDYESLFEDGGRNVKKVIKPLTKYNFYDRKIDAQNKKEKKLEVLRNKKQEAELKYCMKKPQISRMSKMINDKKQGDMKPIYQRTSEIVDKKSLKVDRLKQIYRDIQNSEQSKMTHSLFDEKKFEEWLSKQMIWEANKKNKIMIAKNENERLETEHSKSMHHPNIDKKSDMLARSRILTTENNFPQSKDQSVYEKLYNLKDEKYNKLVKRLVDSIPNFKPTINRKMPNFTKNKVNFTQNLSRNTMTKTKQKHYHSVEMNNNYDVIHEEENEDITPRRPVNSSIKMKKKMNTSVMDDYNNPLKNESDNETDETDIISLYKKALETNNTNKFSNHSTAASNIRRFSIEDRKKLNHFETTYQSNKLSNVKTGLYKINISNASAWNKDKINKIIYKPKIN